MKLITPPPVFFDVVQRRLTLAPNDVLRKAFNFSSVYWRAWDDDGLTAVSLGSPEHTSQAERRFKRAGNPFPGLLTRLPQKGQAVTVYREARRSSFSGLTFQAQAPMFGLEEGSTFLLSRFRAQFHPPLSLTYDIGLAFFAIRSSELTWNDCADDLDFLIAQQLSDFIKREPEVADVA